ncbi:GNAT family N-acetyltransferase [Limosilactobacillus antri]|uniref:GNAT family N-acetyltransferase n=1 Tax=Limosilactobacillus antri TaxID=227943 RepID=UPI001F5A32C7|nr:GNAT family N-acetyltransferase [Limosilactobacillus antri]
MIRKMFPDDLDTIMEIWLASNLDAHAFIGAQYWRDQLPAVRTAIQAATVYCYLLPNGTIAGFVGLTGDYLAGLFVARQYRQQGIGGQLLTFVQRRSQKLALDAYRQNQRAVSFYQRHGFTISQQDQASVHLIWAAPE